MPTFFDPSFTTNMGRTVKYETQIDSGSVGAGASGFVGGMNQRRLRDEAAAARAKEASLNKIASSEEMDIPTKARNMAAIDADYALKWEKGVYEAEKVNAEANAAQAQVSAEVMRTATQLWKAGDKITALKQAQRIDPSITNLSGDPRSDTLNIHRKNNVEPTSIIGLTIAATASSVQFTQAAETARQRARFAQESKTSVSQMEAEALRRADGWQRLLVMAGGDETKAHALGKSVGLDTTFSDTDKALIRTVLRGKASALAVQLLKEDQKLLLTAWGQENKPGDFATFTGTFLGKLTDQLEKQGMDTLKLPGLDKGSTIPPKPSSTSAEVSSSTRSNPLAPKAYEVPVPSIPKGSILLYKDGKPVASVQDTKEGREKATREGYTFQ